LLISTDIINEAAWIIGMGGVVAFPTETYYGLAANPFSNRAVEKIFVLKNRLHHKPVLTIVASEEQIGLLATHIPECYRQLMEHFWPGPLTLIFDAQKGLPQLLTGETGTVGIRMTSHPVARQLLTTVGQPLTATSANLSEMSAALTAQEVRNQLGNKVDYVLDGGATAGGPASTIVRIEDGKLVAVRKGAVDIDALPSCR